MAVIVLWDNIKYYFCQNYHTNLILIFMRTKTIFLQLLALLFLFSVSSCTKDDDEVKGLDPEKAKLEFNNATQEITVEIGEMMSTVSVQSLSFLSGLMDADFQQKMKVVLFQSGKVSLTNFKNSFRFDESGNRKVSEVGDYGIYTYNFETYQFDLTGTSTTLLKLLYPASEEAYGMQQNNAEFLLDNLEYTTINYTEDGYEWEEVVPTKAELSLKVDGNSEMTGSYRSTLSENGIPTSVTANVTTAPYQMQMDLNGSGRNFASNLSVKKNNNLIVGYTTDITYTADMEDVEKISGNYTAAPLKVEGWMNYAAIENHMDNAEETGNYDLAFLNNQLDMKMLHTGLDAKIGDIEFREYTYYGETWPALAIIFSEKEGDFQFLEDFMDEGLYKNRFQRR